MYQAAVHIGSNVGLHAKISLLPLAGLVHLGVALVVLVLGGVGYVDDGGINDASAPKINKVN